MFPRVILRAVGDGYHLDPGELSDDFTTSVVKHHPFPSSCLDSEMTSTRLALEFGSETGALLEVTENTCRDQVVARLIPFGEEHVTIHLREDGALLKTHAWPTKPASVHDEARVSAARALGYMRPEKHGSYTLNAPMNDPSPFVLGDHIVGRLVAFEDLSTKTKYLRDARVQPLSQSPFMCEIYFSREPGIFDPAEGERLLYAHETALGWLYVVEAPPRVE